MYTSILWVALSGYLAPVGIVAPSPRMLRDYRSALERVQDERKPLAVFIGSGPAGWRDVAKEGDLNSEIRETLEQHYVCVYLDVNEETDKQLASSFRMDGPGLVISDQSGQKQAFRSEGELTTAELHRYLVKYADPEVVVSATETPVREEVRYYSPVQISPVCSH
jgi:hypothetical protein